jgi:ribose 5-phosphate isomerase A
MASDRAPDSPPPLSGESLEPAAIDRDPATDLDPATIDRHKDAAARAAAELVQDGMALGLGTGSTVAHLLRALGERAGQLTGTRCVATSPATARIATELGLRVCELDDVGELDLAIDGADQVDPACWLIKGGGGAHTREKIVAGAAARFVVIVSADKLVTRLGPPVPLEVLRFGVQRTLAAVGGDSRLRGIGGGGGGGGGGGRGGEVGGGHAATSPDGNLIADYHGPVEDPLALAARLSATPGVVEHGLFAPNLVSEIFVAGADGVRRRAGGCCSTSSATSS